MGAAEADLGPITVEEDENLDLDYFDVQDLGKLRRRLRTGIEGFQRERELYLDLVRQYLEVCYFTSTGLPIDNLMTLIETGYVRPSFQIVKL